MITLPLFPHESLAARRIANPSVTTWIPRSGGLPEDGVVVYAYVPSIQLKRGSSPLIDKYFIQDGMWVAEWSYSNEVLPIEAVTWWLGVEQVPTPPHENVDWIDFCVEQPHLDEDGYGYDVWIWNAKEKQVHQYWCEGSSEHEPFLYYGVNGDPVLHDEFVSHWMRCKQPEQIEWSFERQIANWKEDQIEGSPTPQLSRRRLQMTLAF